MGLFDSFKSIFGGNSDKSNTNSINTVNSDPNTGMPSSSNLNGGIPTPPSGPFGTQSQNTPSTPQTTTSPNISTDHQLSNSTPTPPNNNQPISPTGALDTTQEPFLPQEDTGNSLDSQGQTGSPAPTTTIITGAPTAPNPEQNGSSNNPDDQTP